ncbi:MAG: carotenoid biosynthesis protein [Chloroflexota bacterium]|nr:carotenoid biosynthesis protein [Chloroflexota bacterium]MDQ5867722.1 carotenoid biosynthesis protein [Chloroflexota bacterium]
MPNLTPTEWVMLVSFGVFCFVFPFATFLMSFDLMPWGMEWMSSLLLAMLGLACGAWMVVNFGRVGLLLSLSVLALGVALEYVGVFTGVPFGEYRYTGVLVPELPGGVPLAIGFAWLLIVVGGLFSARWLLSYVKARQPRFWPTVLLGAVLAVGLDLLLEPVAYNVKHYWEWQAPESEGYYGVPWSNFATWFVAALGMNWLVSRATAGTLKLAWTWLPVWLYGMNVFMFGVVNVMHGFWVPGAVMAALLTLLLVTSVRQRRIAS